MSGGDRSAPAGGRAGAIVLAGGRSARFGRDKLAEPVDGRPLLHHAIAAVAAIDPDLDLVVVLAPDGIADLPPGVRVARDRAAYEGPLAGLARGLAALAPDVDRAVVVGGDMPALVPAVLRRMLADLVAVPTAELVLLEDPSAGGPSHARPLPAAIRRDAATTAVAALLGSGERRLRALRGVLDARIVPAAIWRRLDPEAGSLRDVDRPTDLPFDAT